jgi:O-antigen/teichoic acid export membrane protein
MTDLSTGSPDLNRRIALSTVTQGGAKALHLILNVVSTLAIIRYLAPSAYGDYVLVLTTSMLVGLLADYGTAKLATREVSRDPASENEILGTIIAARLVLCVACVGLLQLVLALFQVAPELHLAALVASLMYFGDALFVVVVVFYVRIRQQYEAIIRVGMEAFETALTLWLVAQRASLTALFAAPTLATALGAAAAVLLVRRRYGTRLRVAPDRLRYLAREALPLGPALLISVCYLKLDALMLAVLRPSRELGLYGSAYQPIEYVFLAAAVLVNVAFPLVSAAYAAGNHERFVTLYRRGTEILITVMIMVPILLLFVAAPLVSRVYGPAYEPAATPLRLLAVALVLMCINGWQAFVLLAGGHQKVTLQYNVAALGVATVACLVFIHFFGMNGAAFASLTTAVFVLTCSSLAVRSFYDAHLALVPLARILGAGAGLVASLWLLQRAGAAWLMLIAASLFAYPLWLFAFGVVRPSMLRALARDMNTKEREPDVIDLTGGVGMPIADASLIQETILAPGELLEPEAAS